MEEGLLDGGGRPIGMFLQARRRRYGEIITWVRIGPLLAGTGRPSFGTLTKLTPHLETPFLSVGVHRWLFVSFRITGVHST